MTKNDAGLTPENVSPAFVVIHISTYRHPNMAVLDGVIRGVHQTD